MTLIRIVAFRISIDVSAWMVSMNENKHTLEIIE